MTATRSNYVNDKINGSQTLVGCNLCYSRSPSGDRLRSRVFSAGGGWPTLKTWQATLKTWQATLKTWQAAWKSVKVRQV